MNESLPGITLSAFVDQYMIASYNDKRAYYLNFLHHAKIAWRDLFGNTIFKIKNVSLPIVKDGDKIYLQKPSDLVRLLSVSHYDDCGYHPLLLDGNVPTDSLLVPVNKSCKKCTSSMCGVVETSITTRTENFGGDDYILKTYYNTLSTGEVYRHEEYLVFDIETNEVVKEVRKVLTCTLDVLPCGCPKPTTENVQKVTEYCGCRIDYTCPEPLLKSEYGYFNHTFDGNKIYLVAGDKYRGGKELPDRLVVAYQSSTESLDEELIVPEYGINCLMLGTRYYSQLFKPNTDASLARRDYNIGKEELLKFMFPFDLDAFRMLQGILPKWG